MALYDAIMKSEKSSCGATRARAPHHPRRRTVMRRARAPLTTRAAAPFPSGRPRAAVLDGMPGPVTSVDVAADGSMVVWTTPEFVFFTCLQEGHWAKGVNEPKPRVLKLAISPADQGKHGAALTVADGAWQWTPVKFDAGTARDEDGLVEREIISYAGAVQMRWNARHATRAWGALSADDAAPAVLHGVATAVGVRAARPHRHHLCPRPARLTVARAGRAPSTAT